MLTRRDFGKIALAAVPVARGIAKPKSKIDGVMIGAQTYSFRDRPVDAAIEAMADIGLSYAELWSGHIEPKVERGEAGRDQLRQWRRTVSMGHFREIRGKFKKAHIELFAFNYSFRDDFTDEEIARGFEIAAALGVKRITASSNVSTAKRVDSYAQKAGMQVAVHNHSRIVPNEFARPEDFELATKGMSNIVINLDIGHFWGAGFDPVDYLSKHHRQVMCLHIKDKKKANDQNMPFGEGDTPIREVMQAIKKNKWKIPAMIEYEYKGKETVAEVRRSYEYLKKCLI
jgi:sugar phosphate isomerase/epimerase